MRTAVGKAKRGSFKNTGPDNLLAPVLKHLVQTTPQIKPELYGDVVIGTVLPPGAQVSHSSTSLHLQHSCGSPGQFILAMILIFLYSPSIRLAFSLTIFSLSLSFKGATEVRVASLLAGLPDIVPCTTVNRQCSSGLQAIANVASAIKVYSLEDLVCVCVCVGRRDCVLR